MKPAGRPAGEIETLGPAGVLHLPLKSERLAFTDVRVSDGQDIRPGRTLATDPDNYSVPLLAPYGGKAEVDEDGERVTIRDAAPPTDGRFDLSQAGIDVPQSPSSADEIKQKLLALGAWQFVYDAHSRRIADPSEAPQAVIVSTMALEPFLARGDVQLAESLETFTRGLKHIQSLLEYQPIYLIVPDVQSELGRKVHEAVRGYAWVEPVTVPLKYPYDNFTVLARGLGLKSSGGPVWGLRVEGVLAAERALETSQPCTERIVSIGGPAVENPIHLRAVTGYPIEEIIKDRMNAEQVRILSGGALTGMKTDTENAGLDAECAGLTAIPEQVERPMFSWARPWFTMRSYSRCVAGAFIEKLRPVRDTATMGEERACVACGYCDEVCPAPIRPQMIHKALYAGENDRAEALGLELCVDCGLCSYVCPSKIELREQFVDAREAIRLEMLEEQAEQREREARAQRDERKGSPW